MLLGGDRTRRSSSAWACGGTLFIYWYSGGVDQGELATARRRCTTGTSSKRVLDGGVIYAKVNGVVVASVANTTTLTSGTPGFRPTSIRAPQSLDDWEAGTPASYTISGTITENAVGLGGVLVTASGGFSGSATTNGSGAYTITGVPPSATSIVLTPTLVGPHDEPARRGRSPVP